VRVLRGCWDKNCQRVHGSGTRYITNQRRHSKERTALSLKHHTGRSETPLSTSGQVATTRHSPLQSGVSTKGNVVKRAIALLEYVQYHAVTAQSEALFVAPFAGNHRPEIKLTCFTVGSIPGLCNVRLKLSAYSHICCSRTRNPDFSHASVALYLNFVMWKSVLANTGIYCSIRG